MPPFEKLEDDVGMASPRAASTDKAGASFALVALLTLVLTTASVTMPDWVRGTAIISSRPTLAVVGLQAVSLGNAEPPLSDGSPGRLTFSQKASLATLCTGENVSLTPLDFAPAERDTDASIWCALERAAAGTTAWIGAAYGPLALALIAGIVRALSPRLPIFSTARAVLVERGVRELWLRAAEILPWALSWLLVLCALTAYAYTAPRSLGWEALSFEGAFGLLRLAFIVLTIGTLAVALSLFPPEDSGVLAESWARAREAKGLTLVAYALLLLQLALHLLSAVHALEWQGVLCLIGLHYVNRGHLPSLLAYAALTALSLCLDVLAFGQYEAWAQMSAATRLAGGAYVGVVFLKICSLATLGVLRRTGGVFEA